jgi:hypothetical protein
MNMKPRLFDIIVVILLVINLLLTAIILDNNTASTERPDVFNADIQPVNPYVVSSTEGDTVVYADIDDILEAITDEEIVQGFYNLQAQYAELTDKTELKDELETFQQLLLDKGYVDAANEMPRVIEATESDDIFVVDSAVAVVLYEVVSAQ